MRYHFSGIAGAGMNPLAQLLRARGHQVQGSDRAFDQGKNQEDADRLRSLGITLRRHDGTAIIRGIDRFVYSTAVEADTPEMRAARQLDLELVTRPALLAEIVNAGRPGIAIAGTCGKSTITGMLAWLTEQAGLAATVLGGAALVGEGVAGCFRAGPEGGGVVAEACESDGTLGGYRPSIGIVHNISRDHGEVWAVREQFATFAASCRKLLLNAGCPEAAALRAGKDVLTYGVSPTAAARLEVLSVGPHRAAGRLAVPGGSLALGIPQPGAHNLDNAAAAALVALELGIAPTTIEAALARFPGVARRFEVVGVVNGIRVVDDYAHNGEKLLAALTTVQAGAERVLAVFQPHGFGPARFLRSELRELLPQVLRAHDRFCYAEIYYAGGSVQKDISSRTLAADLPARMRCAYAADHRAVVQWVQGEARPGDTVLIMGARDPELPRLARAVLASLRHSPALAVP
jgi:UDP-N-acetylmuramate--alanine ligase